MANRLKMVQQELLFSLFKQGWSNRKINKALSIDRRTIARYRLLWMEEKSAVSPLGLQQICDLSASTVLQNVPPKCPPEGVVHFQVPTDPDIHPHSSKSQASPYHEAITSKLEEGQHARSIFQDLVIEHEYGGSYDSIKRYVRQIKKRSPRLYARIETPPGEEAQVDFGEGARVLKNGRYRKPWLFVMTLSNSRHSYQKVIWKQDVETFLTCHDHAFRFFNGVPKTVSRQS